jgi:hypothetical protein
MVRRGIVFCLVKENPVLAICILHNLSSFFCCQLQTSTNVMQWNEMNALTSMHDDDAQFQVPEKFIDLLVE